MDHFLLSGQSSLIYVTSHPLWLMSSSFHARHYINPLTYEDIGPVSGSTEGRCSVSEPAGTGLEVNRLKGPLPYCHSLLVVNKSP